MLVSRTTPAPAPGSDEINRAYEEGWVGNDTLAFIGDTLAENGEKAPAVDRRFAGRMKPAGSSLVGAAGRYRNHNAGAAGGRQPASFDLHPPSPLPGTGERPAPLGARQSQGDGDSLSDARRRRRSAAVAYFPAGGEPRQLTHHASGIQSAFNWHPSGEWLGFALEDRIACCHAGTGDITFLTDTHAHAHAPSADAIVFSPDGKQIA